MTASEALQMLARESFKARMGQGKVKKWVQRYLESIAQK